MLHCSDVFDLSHLQSLPTDLVFVAYVKRSKLFVLPPLVVFNTEGLRASHDTSKQLPGIRMVYQHRESYEASVGKNCYRQPRRGSSAFDPCCARTQSRTACKPG